MKPQIVFIHGGDAIRDPEKLYRLLRGRSFNPYEQRKRWREELFKNLSETHECHSLSMPNAFCADYEAWKIWFEKMVPYLRDGCILIGHSLGGGFLLRYLTENTMPVRVGQLHLVAPVVLDLEDCEGFLIDTTTWAKFLTVPTVVHLWHSADDTLVPIAHSEAFAELYPAAVLHSFADRGHFLTESFPELEATIKSGI
jgi:hypothetical protein